MADVTFTEDERRLLLNLLIARAEWAKKCHEHVRTGQGGWYRSQRSVVEANLREYARLEREALDLKAKIEATKP